MANHCQQCEKDFDLHTYMNPQDCSKDGPGLKIRAAYDKYFGGSFDDGDICPECLLSSAAVIETPDDCFDVMAVVLGLANGKPDGSDIGFIDILCEVKRLHANQKHLKEQLTGIDDGDMKIEGALQQVARLAKENEELKEQNDELTNSIDDCAHQYAERLDDGKTEEIKTLKEENEHWRQHSGGCEVCAPH
jgi:FtsZ-binding cell division protein ZapB